MSDLILSLEAKNSRSHKGDARVILTIKNESEQNCFIPKDTIMLDGFRNDKFTIMSSDNEQSTYMGRLVKYYPELIPLKSDHSLSKELNLSEVYGLSETGSYKISYSTDLKCCSDSQGQDCTYMGAIESHTTMEIY